MAESIFLPAMRPLPIVSSPRVPWWNLWGKIKRIGSMAAPRRWEILEDYNIYIPWLDAIVCAPKGFIFDGASVPRALWPFMSPTGLMFTSGLFHDIGYRFNSWLDCSYKPIYKDAGRSFFDEQFKEIGKLVNDLSSGADSNIHMIPNTAWAALKLFGFMAWNEHRENNINIEDVYKPKIEE